MSGDPKDDDYGWGPKDDEVAVWKSFNWRPLHDSDANQDNIGCHY